jgi:hypothetical protein
MDDLDPKKLAKTAVRRPDLLSGGGTLDMKKLQYEADAMSEHEMAKYQGWAVTIPIRRSKLDIRVYETVYYLRAKNPHLASYFAAALFQRWEKKDQGLEFSRFPEIDDNSQDGQIRGKCERMSDDAFKAAWKEANRNPDNTIYYHGNILNPICFTWYPPEKPWDVAPELIPEDDD